MIAELDVNRLAKVAELIRRGATAGERAAAEAAAVKIAKAAGLTLDEALSIMDAASPPSRPYTFLDAMDDAMEAKCPGWKAKMAEERAERAREQAERRSRVLAEFGSVEAVFAPTERERILSAAVEHLKTFKAWGDGSRYVDTIDGWGSMSQAADLPASVRSAVEGAYPMPADLAEAWEEHGRWEQLKDARYAVNSDYGGLELWAEARAELVASALDTMPIRPQHAWCDLDIRLQRRAEQNNRGFHLSLEEDELFVDRLRDDFAILRRAVEARHAAPVQNEQTAAVRPMTATERRRLVLEALRGTPEATDREIARRFGVSPTTVGSLRRKMQTDDAPLFRQTAA